MMNIYVGRGSVVVENPDPSLKDSLKRFRRTGNGEGEYENLFVMSKDGKSLVTMPGFAQRIMSTTKVWRRIYDRRIRMPDPDMTAAMSGLDECWSDVISSAMKSGGGIISIPEVMGTAATAAAIIRAFPREKLMDRGTPVRICKSPAAERSAVNKRK